MRSVSFDFPQTAELAGVSGDANSIQGYIRIVKEFSSECHLFYE
jgi:hypothetical protein